VSGEVVVHLDVVLASVSARVHGHVRRSGVVDRGRKVDATIGRRSTDPATEQAVPSAGLTGSGSTSVQDAPRQSHDDHVGPRVGFELETVRVRCHRTTIKRL